MQWNIELNSSESKLGARSIAQPVNGVNHITQPVYDPDTVALARTGKRQVLERRFGFVSMTGFSCGLMCTWESMLVVFLLGLQNGGPGGLVCGFIVVWFGTTSVFITISELASMIPTASGQYHWVSALAGEDWKRFWSYVTGWVQVTAWIAGTVAGAFFTASLLQALVILNNPDYSPTGWQGTLMFWAILVAAATLNTVGGKFLPILEIVILILHVLGFFAIMIPLVSLSPKLDAASVFTVFSNDGGWASYGLSFLVGLNGNATAFLGTDGPVHMSEEVRNAQKNVPRSMLLSLLINGVLAFGLLIAVLFCTADLDDAIANAPNGFPFVLILADGVGSIGGATVMCTIVLILEFCSTVGSMAGGSRIVWSFARDKGLPGSRGLSQIERRTTVPVRAVLLVTVCSAAIGLINIGSTTAFNDVVSLVLEGFYASYLVCCGLVLYRRLRRQISQAGPDGKASTLYAWGPWRLPIWFGIFNNVIAIAYLLVMMTFGFFPAAIPVTAASMNYSVLVLGGVATFSLVYYYAWARRSYNGPVVEVKLREI